ncbi:hypothetical protein GCM10022293_12750 [Azospirillum formosense]
MNTTVAIRAVSRQSGASGGGASMTTSGYRRSTVKLVETALSWSAMWGRVPSSAMSVTAVATGWLLP